MKHRVRLKVCCISSINEARLAISLGADALGLVAKMPSGPGVIADDLIREIASATPPPIATFLLTSETHPDSIATHVKGTGVNTVQLVDDALDHAVYGHLRRSCPAVRIVQVIHVIDERSIDHALRVAPDVDALLLDSGNPSAPTPELGGTGRTHNWTLSRSIVDRSPRPVFLAGGLNPGNIADAVRTVQPFEVDLCSGIRTSGSLDPEKARLFLSALHST